MKKYVIINNIQFGGKKLKNKTVKSYNKYNNKYKPDTTMEPKYSEHLSEPWFSLISLGLKQLKDD
jgi:hypothetical protein